MKFGKYQIIKEIGKGAMGIVYLAFDPIIERQVAIKTMNPALFQDKDQRERFFREAKAAGILQHPNIVTIYDMGIENDTPFIVMEYVEGKDLDSMIKNGEIDQVTAVNITKQLCDALHYAHSRGIIHRDIKPSNIRVLPDGTIKIMDFGIAKKRGSDLTQTGVLLGTISYMSPEQLKEGKVSPQSDMFSAGVVFYEMLTGKRCFTGDTITTIMYKIISFNDKDLDYSSIPAEIAAVLRKMLASKPEERLGSCEEAAKLLAQLTENLKTQTGSKLKTSIVPPPIPSFPERKAQSEKKNSKFTFLHLIIFTFVILIILSIFAYFVQKRKTPYKPAKQTKSKEKKENVKSIENNLNRTQNIENQGKTEKENIKKTTRQQTESKTMGDKKEKRVVDKPDRNFHPPLKRRKPLRARKKKEVFSYSGGIEKRESILNFLDSHTDEIERLKHEMATMSLNKRITESNKFFNVGMRALGNGANRFAAINFYKAILLNPQKKEAYSFLCIALARIKAYNDIKKVIDLANKNGIPLYQLRQNILFNNIFKRLKQRGVL